MRFSLKHSLLVQWWCYWDWWASSLRALETTDTIKVLYWANYQISCARALGVSHLKSEQCTREFSFTLRIQMLIIFLSFPSGEKKKVIHTTENSSY